MSDVQVKFRVSAEEAEVLRESLGGVSLPAAAKDALLGFGEVVALRERVRVLESAPASEKPVVGFKPKKPLTREQVAHLERVSRRNEVLSGARPFEPGIAIYF